MVFIRQPISTKDNIISFCEDPSVDHADYPAIGLDNIAATENNHFWFKIRKQLILEKVTELIEKPATILEVGAGTAHIAQAIQVAGFQVAVADIHRNGLHYARKRGIKTCYQLDLYEPPFENEFNAIGLFDVLEHLDDSNKALTNIHSMLNSGGYLFLTVPAHDWLWSDDDVVAGHKRRYTKNTLIQSLTENQFEIVHCEYIFQFIMPLLWLRTILRPDKGGHHRTAEEADIAINPVINTILYGLSKSERLLKPILPNTFGGSILCVAQKSQNS